ncbi:hypothetical protein GIY62_33025 [Burkholderia plantarii]|uniref:hypothetical protein n=1 Tax=Burkholderia plantarii TaxID=41899 RepID=UPI002729A07A|nr:hypothetical protein [Burkholderia plantarii]WLE62219.1 hypothetical protein GIY62_33025 [Burkholderia plantarii]
MLLQVPEAVATAQRVHIAPSLRPGSNAKEGGQPCCYSNVRSKNIVSFNERPIFAVRQGDVKLLARLSHAIRGGSLLLKEN